MARIGWIAIATCLAVVGTLGILSAQDPAEPLGGKVDTKSPPAPPQSISRSSIDEAFLRSVIEELAACGTRHSLSSWDNPQHGIGCGRDHVLARYRQIATESGGKLQVSVDRFEATSDRTAGKPAHLENVWAILPGTDPVLTKTVFLVSGHYDSRASDPNDPVTDAPALTMTPPERL